MIKTEKKSSHQANPINQGSDNMKQGWEIKKLGEIGKVSMCKRVFKEDTTPEGDIPFYKIGTFGKSPDAFITKEKYEEFRSKFSFPKKGDILISASGTIGRRVRYDGEPAYFQDSNIVWIDNNEKQVLNDYLYRFYEICNWQSTKGATISRLYNENLRQIEIHFPKSLPEQQRIVSILDKAFSVIERSRNNAEQNLKNAKELFESYLQGVFENGKWEKKELRELTSILGDGLHGTPKYTIEGEYYFINGNNLNDGKIEFKENTKRVNIDEFNKHKKNLADSTVLVSINGTLGNIAFYNGEKIILGKSACYFNLKENVDKGFVKYVLSSRYFINYANREATGATIKNVSLKSMREFKVPCPPLKEQQTIVRQLDALRAETQKLEAVYQKKIADLEELKKSILQKAFAGELN